MKEDSKKKTTQKILILASGLMFLGSTSFGLITMLSQGTQPQNNVNAQVNDLSKELLTQEKGFEEVLKREPNSRFALQGLFDTRIKLYQLQKDNKYLAKSLEPLDKLIELYPKEEGLKLLKDQVKKELAGGDSSNKK